MLPAEPVDAGAGVIDRASLDLVAEAIVGEILHDEEEVDTVVGDVGEVIVGVHALLRGAMSR